MRDFKVGDRVRLVNGGKTDNGAHPSWANAEYIVAGVYDGEFEIVLDDGVEFGSQRYTLHGITPLPNGHVALIYRGTRDLILESNTVRLTRRLTVKPIRYEE